MNAVWETRRADTRCRYERLRFRLQSWDVDIVVKRRRGHRFTMEDYVWFEPPFESSGRQYVQCFVLDGHSTHPLELESLYEKGKQCIKAPFHADRWQTMVGEEDARWSSNGGLVVHVVSLSFPIADPRQVLVIRGQIGDCNSVIVQSNAAIARPMEVHNTTNPKEFARVSPWCSRGRVGGVLECTRVIGNTKLKHSLVAKGAPADLLYPLLLTEITHHRIKNDRWVAVVGTDGLFGDRDRVDAVSHITHSMIQRDVATETIADLWLNASSHNDNVAFVLLSFTYNGL